jgi:hypothetical protein
MKLIPQKVSDLVAAREVSKADLMGSVRIAGALCLGNSVVLPLLTGGDTRYWPLVASCGILIMVVGSIKKR